MPRAATVFHVTFKKLLPPFVYKGTGLQTRVLCGSEDVYEPLQLRQMSGEFYIQATSGRLKV